MLDDNLNPFFCECNGFSIGDTIPTSVSELKQRAKEASEKSKENGQDGVDVRDCLLLEVLRWFGSFFHWKDKPVCADCGTKTEAIGPVQPTTEDRRWHAGRVEGYKCPKCGKDERYPRYNHPGKLLETRCGRCGETANCKALVLRSMGFEVRHVSDWTDHVWVEVYSDAQQRWIHCDGGQVDKNLLYERSWGKKLNYIIAFSNEEVVDVTWRYSVKQDEVRERRLLVSEEWLSKTLRTFNSQRQQRLSPERREILLGRSAKELAEFFSVYAGKLLGTAAWRRMIGRPESQHEPHTFKPSDEEIYNKRLRIQFSCSSDKYYRGCKMEAFLDGWKSGAAAVNSVFRKCEYDWRTVCDYLHHRGVKEADLVMLQKGNVYLARLQGSPSGLVTWQFDFTSCALVIDTITVATQSNTTENGQVEWKLDGDDEIVQNLDFSGDQEPLTTSSLSGCKSFKLTASLSGGNGPAAWQHAQIFSQPIDSEDEIALDITVTLRDSES
ncbi:peptide-N(4)-(N-acetyl-beta-glucosaminyl)asparagine amidase-like isoform X2 [Oculina patagonica]